MNFELPFLSIYHKKSILLVLIVEPKLNVWCKFTIKLTIKSPHMWYVYNLKIKNKKNAAAATTM